MIKLKIGRHVYNITVNDRFMDNGFSVLLTTQNKNKVGWISQAVVLSKKSVREIDKYKHNMLKHNYGTSVKVFSLIDF